MQNSGSDLEGSSKNSAGPRSADQAPNSDAPTLVPPIADTGPAIQPGATLDPEATVVDLEATWVEGVTRSPASGRQVTRVAANVPLLEPGAVLGERYEIVHLLGEGGMGAVYKARDRELDRFVALKLVRPELAANPAMIARFKRELLLSHQVTHKNVIRIYDLGDADGVKFISMEFVDGRDLRSIMLERKKLAPEQAAGIIQQVCHALDAAHSVGVIHRDLKPQNIMQDKSGRILVMDFGMARTFEGDNMTQTGALVGTLEYMSPEQALAQDLDQRSDIYAVGLILYELLSGDMPFHADSAVASLIKRTTQRAAPVSERDKNIPEALSNIVGKCLEPDKSLRYQSAAELLADLEAWQGKRPVSASVVEASAVLSPAAISTAGGVSRGSAPAVPARGWLRWVAVAAVVLVVGVAAFFLRNNFGGSAKPGPVQSLAILPFRNASGDTNLDWLGSSLADMLTSDIGQSAQLRTVSPSSLHQIFSDLRISPSTELDPPTIRRVADFSNTQRVVWGQYARFGDQIRIDVTLQDFKNDRSIPLKVDVPSEKEIPAAVERLAESIRGKLSLPSTVLKELKASSFEPKSNSVEALRAYNLGVGFQRDGRNLDAQRQLEAATKADPNFALAFSRLSQVYSILGYDADAETASQKAVALSQDAPDAEKFLISAIRFQATKNYPEAIKAYESLEKGSPDNADVQSALASLYTDSGNLAKAREYYQKILSANPKDVGATLDLGRIEIKNGNAQGSFDPLNRAYSLAVQVGNDEQKATSLHLMAVAYRMLNKPDEVLRNEQQALAIWRQVGQKRGLAFSLNEMARAQAALGKSKDATANFEEALQLRREIGDKRGLGDTLIDMGNFSDDHGDHDQALKTYKEALQLERDIGNESLQAICLSNIGSVYSEKNQYEDALTYFQQALQLREKSKVPQDIVVAVHDIGETLANMGQYDQAIANYMRALDLHRSTNDTRGAALDSYGLGDLFDYQGRLGAAINALSDAVKTLRDLKESGFWMAEVLGNWGEALIRAGRADEAKAPLEKALAMSRELKNDLLTAQMLGFQGDAYFYQGNFKAARPLYQQALQNGVRNKDPERILSAQLALAEVEVSENKGPQAISALRTLVQKADELSLKYSSVEASIFLGEAMMQAHNPTHAKQELQRALQTADHLGQLPLSARAHYLLAALAKTSGDKAEVQDHAGAVVRILDTMKKEAGAEKLLQRSDFKQMYEDSTRWAQAEKS
jgi:tetratricopeptide (TPR) repeat protein/predicted Ser/Thr protein kinase